MARPGVTADAAVVASSGPRQVPIIRLLVGIVGAAALMVLLVKVDAVAPSPSHERAPSANGAAHQKP